MLRLYVGNLLKDFVVAAMKVKGSVIEPDRGGGGGVLSISEARAGCQVHPARRVEGVGTLQSVSTYIKGTNGPRQCLLPPLFLDAADTILA